MATQAAYGERPAWTPARPRFRPFNLFLAWVLGDGGMGGLVGAAGVHDLLTGWRRQLETA